jgi:hypothetical protein
MILTPFGRRKARLAVHIIGGLIGLAAMGGLTGCVVYYAWFDNGERDVTKDQSYWGGYSPGREFVLVQDALVVGTKASGRLCPPGFRGEAGIGVTASGEKMIVPTVEEYQRSPQAWPRVAGILSRGACIRVEKLVRRPALEGGLAVWAVVLAGDFQGTHLEIDYLSRQDMRSAVLALAPIPAYLKPVEAGGNMKE